MINDLISMTRKFARMTSISHLSLVHLRFLKFQISNAHISEHSNSLHHLKLLWFYFKTLLPKCFAAESFMFAATALAAIVNNGKHSAASNFRVNSLPTSHRTCTSDFNYSPVASALELEKPFASCETENKFMQFQWRSLKRRQSDFEKSCVTCRLQMETAGLSRRQSF